MIFRRSRTAGLRPPSGYSGLQRIPSGGAVVAFRAVQEGLGRPVLLFIAPRVRDFDRFRWVLAALPAHPGIATVYDAGRTTDGHPYVTTAAVGGSLWDRIGAGGPLAPAAATALVLRLQLLAVIHRGMAPDPAGRYGSAAEFATALRNLDGEPSLVPPPLPATVPAPVPAPGTAERLPPDAMRDGAGVIIRRQPADDSPVAALSRTDGRLPETYVAVPLKPGQQYCFLVGVLLRRSGGGTTLAQSGPSVRCPADLPAHGRATAGSLGHSEPYDIDVRRWTG